VSFPSGYGTDGRVLFQTADPLPATIQAISMHVVSNTR